MNLHEELSEFVPETRADRRARERRKKFRRRRMVAIITIVVVVGLLAAGIAVFSARGAFDSLVGSNDDYSGQGHGSVEVKIERGTSARAVANQLVKSDVIEASKPFLKVVEERQVTIKAGTFTMRKHMSSKAAVALLEKGQASNRVVVGKGATIKQIKAKMVKAGLPAAKVKAAIDKKKPKDYGWQVKAPSLEGYLFPATYEVHDGTTAKSMVTEMVKRSRDRLNTLAIDNDSANDTLALASLVQVEAGDDPDVQKKVARVFKNRLGSDSQTQGKLQSDATVAYIFGAREDLTTTAKQRKSKSPYNTYIHKGLPPGPVNTPGDDALAAAKRPTPGPWQYFVATDPDAGTVKFATTYKEHKKNVAAYRKWLRKHHGQTADPSAKAPAGNG